MTSLASYLGQLDRFERKQNHSSWNIKMLIRNYRVGAYHKESARGGRNARNLRKWHKIWLKWDRKYECLMRKYEHLP